MCIQRPALPGGLSCAAVDLSIDTHRSGILLLGRFNHWLRGPIDKEHMTDCCSGTAALPEAAPEQFTADMMCVSMLASTAELSSQRMHQIVSAAGLSSVSARPVINIDCWTNVLASCKDAMCSPAAPCCAAHCRMDRLRATCRIGLPAETCADRS